MIDISHKINRNAWIIKQTDIAIRGVLSITLFFSHGI